MPRRPTAQALTPNRQRDRLLAQIGDLRQLLRGTLATRYRRCGRPNCHCSRSDDPGHGPAYYLVVTVAPGRTEQVYVPKDHKKAVQTWLKNFRLARQKLEKITTLNRRLLKQGKLF